MSTFFAACTPGLEEVLAGELEGLGAEAVEGITGGVRFSGSLPLGYTACLWLRSAIKVQEELAVGTVQRPGDLYDLAAQCDWSASVRPDGTLAVHAATRDNVFRDSRYAGQVVKDAVVDQIRDRTGRRPAVDRDRPDLPIVAVLRGPEARLYRDLAGVSLHKRGYRPAQVRSPLNEALAAGLLLLTGWRGDTPMLDPMCGAATFCIEAAHLAGDRAPGLGRSFAFERWPDLDAGAWERAFEDAEERAARGRDRIPPIAGSDRHPGAVALARRAVRAAGVADHVRLEQRAVTELAPEPEPDLVCTNPPYGERLADDDPAAAWRDLGRFLKRHCQGAHAFVLSGNKELTRHLGLRAERRWPVRNGPIDCRWIGYRIRS